MLGTEITIPVAVLALLRGDVSTRFLADRFGVTEAQVHQWRDVFVVAGVMALHEHGRRDSADRRQRDPEDPTTQPPTTEPIGCKTTTPGPG